MLGLGGCVTYRTSMNAVLNPVGPEDPKTYWKRRALVLGGVVLALIVLVVLIGRAFGGGNSDSTAQPAASPSPAQTAEAQAQNGDEESGAEPSDQESAGQGGESETDQGASPDADSAEVMECADSDIAVTVETDSGSYDAGQGPTITMMITNTSDEPCARDIGAAANEVKITSGGFDVWSSDDCASSEKEDIVEMPANESASVKISWDRKLSAPGCAGERSDAQPGAYQVVGRNGSVTSDEAGFVLAS